jgi:adenylate cyclase
VGASLEILKQLDRLNAAGKIHPTRVGIGLHMGEALTGNVGSADRKEYTIIGDVVNLESRLEQATKEFYAQLLISEEVRRNLDAAISSIEVLGSVALKGQPNPARIFKVA